MRYDILATLLEKNRSEHVIQFNIVINIERRQFNNRYVVIVNLPSPSEMKRKQL